MEKYIDKVIIQSALEEPVYIMKEVIPELLFKE